MSLNNSNNINLFNSPFSVVFLSSIVVIAFEQLSNISLGLLGDFCWLFFLLSLGIIIWKFAID
ncbi:MAG: hypothetical protein PWQ75_12 [Methanolobus sp.]|jgi:uncharacterized membrane protein|nr:hypothetical protein [Methanolobus sp.]